MPTTLPEYTPHRLRELSLQQITKETASYNGSRTLVAKNITQRSDIFHNSRPVIEAAV
jgi:uncharacterized SAM-dependent methyltransferase